MSRCRNDNRNRPAPTRHSSATRMTTISPAAPASSSPPMKPNPSAPNSCDLSCRLRLASV
ncbi:hypothetical protein F3168_00715 [Polymorphobacter fuscus]|uniref:Uncharacterized protein n=1 Tax=Sandarakinorhabdus fusca TaxID=1439888 RepID=A0A7C9KWA3_9SPHN|nr:hypothetical protein F9290_00715 [Polymorphobacter fuscus]MQT15786.1 hypothetical protein [Polymorphobacter fuscus]